MLSKKTQSLTQRLVGKKIAAKHCGVCIKTYDNWVSKGLVPSSLPHTNRYDLKALDLALDKLSGIEQQSEPEDEFETWFNESEIKAHQ